MFDIDDFTPKLKIFTHNLFTKPLYGESRGQLCEQKTNRWYSLIAELDKATGSIEELTEFGDDIYMKFVYRCIPTPDFKNSREIMVLFNVSGWMWHSLIYFQKNKV